MSTTCTPREKDPPHSIADSCNQIIRYFDQLDRESAAKGP
jgi:hypothetical protein